VGAGSKGYIVGYSVKDAEMGTKKIWKTALFFSKLLHTHKVD
jgi:hypothetical protein